MRLDYLRRLFVLIALGATAYVGLGVTSHFQGVLTTAVLSNAAVVTFAASKLPSLLKAEDIGGPAIAGSTSYRAGTYTIEAGGTDIWSTADEFHYVYQAVTGDVEVVARVTAVGNADPSSKGGVMIRESLAANSRHATAFASSGDGYSFQRRVDTGGFSTSSGIAAGAPPVWLRLVRSGYRLEAYRSTDGTTWTSMGFDTVPMADAVFVGVAATSHNPSVGTTVVVDNLKITPISSTGNRLPTVALTTPTTGASFTAPANLTLTATASDPENRLARVEFYSGATLIGAVSEAPFSMTWPSVAAGTYSLTAMAVDLDGGTATSTTATVSVRSATNQSTTVGLAAAPVACPCTIWSATTTPSRIETSDTNAVELGVRFRSDTNGTVTGVRFYKSTGNTGTHTGSLWTNTGTLLATATFSGETATGWQQVTFNSPVAITANTSYVVSYHTNTGQYAVDNRYFATSGVDNPPLHAPATGVGTNGVYRYGASAFPNQTFEASNYWVDVVFSPGGSSATVPPTVAISAPAAGASFTAPATVTVSASATDPDGRMARVEFYVGTTWIGTDTTAPYSASWAASSGGAYVLKAIAYDADGGSTSSATVNVTVTLNAPPAPGACPCTIWSATTTPSRIETSDTNAVELGVRFRSDTNGTVTGVRFYKGTGNTGTHTGSLWTNTGTLLATATFSGETATGWQQVTFNSPVAITANTSYVVSYHTNTGQYAVDNRVLRDERRRQSTAPCAGHGRRHQRGVSVRRECVSEPDLRGLELLGRRRLQPGRFERYGASDRGDLGAGGRRELHGAGHGDGQRIGDGSGRPDGAGRVLRRNHVDRD